MMQPIWNIVWQFLKKVKPGVTIWLRISHLYTRESKIYFHTKTYIWSLTIHNSQKVEITQMSIKWWINKIWSIHTMGYYVAIKRNGVMRHTLTWLNLEDIKWKKPGTKGHVLHDSIYTKCWE